METYQAVIEGNSIQFIGQVPLKSKFKATVTINETSREDIEAKIKRMESFCGLFDDDDVRLIEEMKEEQRNLPKRNRDI